MKTKPLTVLRTDGSGLWSKHVAEVSVLDLEVSQTISTVNSKGSTHTYGELRVYFDSNKWRIDRYGLIYTDKLFINLLRSFLKSQGFSDKAVTDINYSEQGMQSYEYVSFDVAEDFLAEVDPLVNFTKGKRLKINIPVEVYHDPY